MQFYAHLCTVFVSRELDNPSGEVAFVHQSSWQQRIMALYGSDVCVVDSTYKTTLYELPLFVLCVPTNVGYVNVASMLLCNETHESIASGLRKIAAWNPLWQPRYFMTDFSEAQISALEAVFPGRLPYLILAWTFVLCHPDVLIA